MKIFWIFFAGILVFFGVLMLEYQKTYPEKMEMIFFETNHGDSILIRTPEGKNFLVDTGQDADIRKKIAKRLPFWDKKLDAVFITHPDADHFFGVFPLLESFQIEHIFLSGIVKDDASFRSFFEELEEKNIPFHFLSAPQNFSVDGMVFETLFPTHPIAGKISKDANGFSLVMKISYGNFSALLTGDIEKEGEKEMLENGKNLKSTLLKVAHHGSKTSTTKEFLNAVDPKIAVISVGNENSFGHPHLEVLNRFFEKDIAFFSNLHGDIVLQTDGKFWGIVKEY